MKPSIPREKIAAMNQCFKCYSLETFLATYQQLGVKAVSIWGGPPHFQLDPYGYSDCRALKQKLQTYGMQNINFVPAGCLFRYQYAARGRELREDSYRYFLNGLYAAYELGGGKMTIHSGWGYDDEPWESAWNRSVDMIGRLCQKAHELGITLTMESMMRRKTNLVYCKEHALKLWRDVRHPSLKIMIDTAGITYQHETVEQWMSLFGEQVVDLHFNDSGFLAWGDGTLNLPQLLQTLQQYHFSGYYIQEIADPRYFRDPITAAQRAMQFLSPYLTD